MLFSFTKTHIIGSFLRVREPILISKLNRLIWLTEKTRNADGFTDGFTPQVREIWWST